MKTYALLLGLIVISISLSSCWKAKQSGTTMSAMVNDTSWVASTSSGSVHIMGEFGGAGLSLQGYGRINGRTIMITITDDKFTNTVGTYYMNDTNAVYAIFVDTTTHQGGQATSGTLTFTRTASGYAQGTFSFTAGNTNVTQGQFSVNW